jgi:hypothetical protein
MIDGVPCGSYSFGGYVELRHGDLYVDPNTGILRIHERKDGGKKKTTAPKLLVKENDNSYLCKVDGIWYRIIYKLPVSYVGPQRKGQANRPRVNSRYDYQTKKWNHDMYIPFEREEYSYFDKLDKRDKVAYRHHRPMKRQLSSKELKKNGLTNDR